MLLSRKRDSNFQNLLISLVDRYSRLRFNYNLDPSQYGVIKVRKFFDYTYHYNDLDLDYNGFCSVLVRFSNTYLVHKNMMVFGVSLSFSHVLIDVDGICKDIWEKLIDSNYGKPPNDLTLKDLRDYIVGTVPSYDDTSGVIENSYEYKGFL